MTTHTRLLAAFILSVALNGGIDVWGQTMEFDVASVFIEINATDGDAGFQGVVDGEAWKKLKLTGPNGKKLFKVKASRSLKQQGLTEYQWESAEPEFNELLLSVFLERFPAGNYTFIGKTVEGAKLRSTAELTHNLPDGPEITAPIEDGVVDPTMDLSVTWNAVTTQFNTNEPLDGPIVKYTVTVETDDDGAEKVMNFDVISGTSATIAADFLDPDRHWKLEIGATEISGNSTFREIVFCTFDEAECPDDADE